MPYKIDLTGGYVHVRMFGTVTSADLLRLAEEAVRIEATAEPTPDRIIDLSEAEEMDLNFSDMELIASLRRAAKFKNPVRSAMVTRTPVQFGFARMFQTLNDNPQIEIAIFGDEGAALQWTRAEKRPPKLPRPARARST